MRKTVRTPKVSNFGSHGQYCAPNERENYKIDLYQSRWDNHIPDLADIGAACHVRMVFLISTMAKQENVTEALKATEQMKWVSRMNNIRNRAEEIVFHELDCA